MKTFGEFKVSVGEHDIKTSEWGQKKARDVFKILLIHHKVAMNADELIELVWGNLSRKNKNVKASLLNANFSKSRISLRFSRFPKLMRKQKNSDGALLFAEKMLDIDRVFEPAFQLLFEIYASKTTFLRFNASIAPLSHLSAARIQ